LVERKWSKGVKSRGFRHACLALVVLRIVEKRRPLAQRPRG